MLDKAMAHRVSLDASDLLDGEYILVVAATDSHGTSVDSQVFTVDLGVALSASFGMDHFSLLWFALVALIAVALGWFLWIHHRGHGRGGRFRRRRSSGFAASLGLGELQGKLMALEEAKAGGFVKDSSYRKGKRSLSSKMKKRLGR
jgi:hypothetical protein